MAGVRLRGGDAQDSATVCVIRLLPDGRPDPAFSGDGVALVDHGYGNDSAEAVLLRGGKVIVAGEGRRRVGEQPLRDRAPARRRPPRPLVRPPRPPARLLRRAAPRRRPTRSRRRRAAGSSSPAARWSRAGSRRWRSRGSPAAAASTAACAPHPARSAATRGRCAPRAAGSSSRAAPTPSRARARPTGRSPATRRRAALLGVDARPTSAPARTRPRRSRSRPATRRSPARSTRSHGVARYLTRPVVRPVHPGREAEAVRDRAQARGDEHLEEHVAGEPGQLGELARGVARPLAAAQRARRAARTRPASPCGPRSASRRAPRTRPAARP